MLYDIDNIMRDVRVAMDQNGQSAALREVEDNDTLTLDELIESKIEDGVRLVESEAPTELLGGCGKPFGDTIFWNEQQSGWVPVPDDFMRLISFRMSDWSCAVNEPMNESDPRYRWQSSRYKGLRGTPQRPVCAIVRRSQGMRLEFFSCKDDNAICEDAVYLPVPRIEDHHIEVSERCYRASVLRIAALVLSAVGASTAEGVAELSRGLIT